MSAPGIRYASAKIEREDRDHYRPFLIRLPVIGAIFVLALAFRLVTIHFYHWPVVTDLYLADQAALNLLAGHGFTSSLHEPFVPSIFRTPGYSVFLAALYWFFGHSFTVAVVANAVLDSITAVMLALIGSRMSGAGLGLLCGLLYAMYPYSAALCAMIHQDILLTTAVTFVLWATVRGQQRPESTIWWTVCGIGIGVIVLIKPLLLAYVAVPLLVLAISRLTAKQKLARAACLVGTAALLIFPWVVRNYIQFQEFPILASGTPDDAGMATIVQELDAAKTNLTMRIITNDIAVSRESYLSRLVDGKPLIVQTRQAREENLAILLRRWPEWLRATVEHVPRLWITAYSRYDPGLRSHLISVFSAVTFLLGLMGIIVSRKEWRLFLACYLTLGIITAIYAPLHVEARYTLPARPAMLLFIGTLLHRFAWLRIKCAKIAAVTQ